MFIYSAGGGNPQGKVLHRKDQVLELPRTPPIKAPKSKLNHFHSLAWPAGCDFTVPDKLLCFWAVTSMAEIYKLQLSDLEQSEMYLLRQAINFQTAKIGYFH